jgi:hypothetical protein
MNNNNVNNLRRKKWIDPFQTGLVLRIGLYCLLCQQVVWAFNFVCDQVDQYGAVLGADLSAFSNIYVRLLLTLLVISLPLMYESIQFAHRLVGPLYRFRMTIRDIAEGKPVPLVQLRQGDYLQDMRDDFNAMLEHFERQGAIVIKRSPATASPAPAVTPANGAIATPAPAHS